MKKEEAEEAKGRGQEVNKEEEEERRVWLGRKRWEEEGGKRTVKEGNQRSREGKKDAGRKISRM